MSVVIRYSAPGPRGLRALLLLTGLACGSAADDEGTTREPTPPASGGASAPPASDVAPSSASDSAEASEAALLAEVLERAGDQFGATCGPAIDACGATAGCNEILACAARSGCTGAECYCADAGCTSPGPCREVIDAAPGARAPDASGPSRGPATDAAAAVGACLQGFTGGAAPGTPPAPAGGFAADAGAGGAPEGAN